MSASAVRCLFPSSQKIGSNDIARSKKFYDALFTAMGAQPVTEDARGRPAYSHNGGRFMVSKPIDGKAATNANGGTIGFRISLLVNVVNLQRETTDVRSRR
jgi:hypothetical protein